MNPANHNPRRITKADKYFVKRLDPKDIKLPVKTRDFHRIGKKNSIRINVFGYENKAKHPIHVSKKILRRKTCCLIIDGRRRKKKQYILINRLIDFNRFIYDHSLHHARKYFCRYCLHAFITEETLKHHIKDCFKIMANKRLRCLRKVNMLNLNILQEK